MHAEETDREINRNHTVQRITLQCRRTGSLSRSLPLSLFLSLAHLVSFHLSLPLSLSPHSQSLSSNGWGYTAKEDLGARSVCFFSSLVCFRSLPPGFPHELLIPALVLRMRRICLWGRRNKGRENKEQQGGKFCKREWAKRSFLFLQAQARLVREASCYWNKQCLLLLFYVYYLVSFLTRHIQNISLPPLELQLTVPAEHFSKLRTFYFFKSA